jgi:hypothetical protein
MSSLFLSHGVKKPVINSTYLNNVTNPVLDAVMGKIIACAAG